MSRNIKTVISPINLLKEKEFKSFLKVQTKIAIAQCGGISLYTNRNNHQNRIVSDVNLLDSQELRGLIYENFIAIN